MLKDIQIAQSAKMIHINEIAKQLDINENDLELFGNFKAKISNSIINNLKDKPNGKLILVTAINPTPAGEGKTTTSIGLAQAMNKIGKKTVVALREPSLGPVFGLKGGAAGGGYSQVVPMEDINLHFTGDMHAITTANNLLSAMLDNHLQQGNSLNIDPRQILFKRCLDMNDRALRQIIIGLGGKSNGAVREDGFQITVASEVMAILCLATNIDDLKMRLGNILIAYTYQGEPIFAKDLSAHGAMTALLKSAFNPNLVQTLENTPAIIHGGPFANIAHGCNSIRATNFSLKVADYTITEAGFGSDLGAEKFFNIKCRYGNLAPSCVVIVSTVRALKYNGGVDKLKLSTPNTKKLKSGLVNLNSHIKNMQKFGIPVVVAINKFDTDTNEELDIIANLCNELECEFAISEVFSKGGDGGIELAQKVVESTQKTVNFKFSYDINNSIEEKVNTIATEIYNARGVVYSNEAKKSIDKIQSLGLDKMPICIAKTPYSLSDNPKLLGAPSEFEIKVSDVKVCVGAGFIVIYTGDVMTMPGLPKNPAANTIDVDQNSDIVGLF